MAQHGGADATSVAGPAAEATAMPAKEPRTERGRRTRRALLDAAAAEFGERGFHDASISGITARAGVALGSFYTWFDSKEALFRALVADMSEQVRERVAPHVRAAPDGLAAERAGLSAFLTFVRDHKEIYRIIDEAEFVDPASFRRHYAGTAERIVARLTAAATRGELRADPRPDAVEVQAWAIMGMNVFLGLRYGVWSEDADLDGVTNVAADLLRRGLAGDRD